MTPTVSSRLSAGSDARSDALWPGVLALLIGAVFILGAGFSHVSAAHNAAHDARHAAGFPCH